uniref:Uncharacterized protein n=1 Tax=Trichogramma kaykai TaxID=54128 RepID=A0ABD2W280_9HYME
MLKSIFTLLGSPSLHEPVKERGFQWSPQDGVISLSFRANSAPRLCKREVLPVSVSMDGSTPQFHDHKHHIGASLDRVDFGCRGPVYICFFRCKSTGDGGCSLLTG